MTAPDRPATASSSGQAPRYWWAWSLASAVSIVLVGSIFAVLALVVGLTRDLPEIPNAETLVVSTVVVDRNDRLLRPFTTPEGRWRLPVGIDAVDRRYLDMLIAYEDKNYYSHSGIDWQAMLRAGMQFVGAGGRIVSGGSTLSMQVARLIDRTPTGNLAAKIRQMALADRLEQSLSKDEILTLYLTLAPFGGNIEGVRAASLSWFGKEPARLTTAEAALLVALPQSPEARRPDRDADAARMSRDRVLDRLTGAGLLSPDEAEFAKREPVPSARRDFPLLAPHLARTAVANAPQSRHIALTVDLGLQQSLETLAAARAAIMGPDVSVGIVVADLGSGEVLASVGSAGLLATRSDGFVDMTRAERSPGSTLKPLIYGLAFELGLAHPESLIADRPTGFSGYDPVNFDGLNHGTVTMRQALTQSLNVPAVIVLDAVGPARLLARLKRANVQPVLPDTAMPGLAIGLGGVGVTLRDLVSLYGAIARGGAPFDLIDGAGPARTWNGARPHVLDELAAWYVSDILAGVPPPHNGAPGRIAYKTGTSYGYRDAWSIGFDGKTVIGVWVGRPDGASMPGLTGISAAAPLLFESFDRLGAPATPLPRAPSGAILAANAQLPLPLRNFRHPNAALVARSPAPEITFPSDGVDVDLGLSEGYAASLVVKVRNGVPPFTYFLDGDPVVRADFARQTSLSPEGPGFVTLSVVDADGQSDIVKVFLR
ncbi:MAG: penicillin-binding protein 1C [Alphaproteobacteria bacterium]|nr:penicillin-binding protein 1C [Alphaproteobacteria bacterium]